MAAVVVGAALDLVGGNFAVQTAENLEVAPKTEEIGASFDD